MSQALFDAPERNTGDVCKLCGSSQVFGELAAHAEIKNSEKSWMHLRTVWQAPMCQACFEWTAEIARDMVTGEGSAAQMLTRPVGLKSGTRGPLTCDGCGAEHGERSWILEHVPFKRVRVSRARQRHDGALGRYRLCDQCRLWWRVTIEDSSAARMSSFRRGEGSVGEWLDAPARDAIAVSLDRRDASVLQTTVTTMGYSFVDLTERLSEIELGSGLNVMFADAAWLAPVLNRFPTESLREVIVIARTDTLPQACQAMANGVTDVLASPVSPQQIVGAIARMRTAPMFARHPECGLRIYPGPVPKFGMPAILLKMPGAESDLPSNYLRLRRFLRGYDGIGVDEAGTLVANVLAPASRAQAIVDRLSLIIGDSLKIEVAGTAEATAGLAAA